MPPKNVKKGARNVIDAETLAKAIKEVTDGNLTIRNAARAYNINYSSLQRYTAAVKKAQDKPESAIAIEKQLEKSVRTSLGAKPVFNPIQEKAFANYLKQCGKMNYGLSINNTLFLANQYAEQLEELNQLKVPRPNAWKEAKKATKNWYYGFMKRNSSLSLRKPTPTSLARSRGVCKQSVEEFFTNYCSVFDEAAKAAKAAATAAKKAAKAVAKAAKAAATAAKEAAKEVAKAAKAAATAATPKTSRKRKPKTNKKSAQKRMKQESTSSEEDIDFCMAKGCGKLLDKPMTKNNTIKCNKCRRPYHLRCVTMRSFFTCDNCNSDLDLSDE